MSDFVVLYGPSQQGKTTYVRKLDELLPERNQLYIDCEFITTGYAFSDVIADSLENIMGTNERSLMSNYKYFTKAIINNNAVIIDSAQLISMDNEADKTQFRLLLKSIDRNIGSNSHIWVIFDLDSQALERNSVYIELVHSGLVDKNNLKEFEPDQKGMRAHIEEVLGCKVPAQVLDQLLSLSNMRYDQLNMLLHIMEKNGDTTSLSEVTSDEFAEYKSGEQIKKLDSKRMDLLKKASVVGQQFSLSPFVSSEGFNLPHALDIFAELAEVEHVLETLECPNYISFDEKLYKFLNVSLYNSIYKGLDSDSKTAWEKIFLNFFVHSLRKIQPAETNLRKVILTQIRELASNLHDSEKLWFADEQLLYMSLNRDDFLNARDLLNDMMKIDIRGEGDPAMIRYLSILQMDINVHLREFKICLNLIERFEENNPHSDFFYVRYLRALALYSTGNLDESYDIVTGLLTDMREKSHSALAVGAEDRAKVYALKASAMHHMGMIDKISDSRSKNDNFGAEHYFRLARNNANELEDKTLYNQLLYRSDMFMKLSESEMLLRQSINFFDQTGEKIEAAEARFNLATELMLCKENDEDNCRKLFLKARAEFQLLPNESLLYVNNNLAIASILYDGDFDLALSLFESCLKLVDDRDPFTFFTLYLNISMCHLHMQGSRSYAFKASKVCFDKYSKKVSSGEHASLYSRTYPGILNALVDEYEGRKELAHAKAANIQQPGAFAEPLISDLKIRTEKAETNAPSTTRAKVYPDNAHYYKRMNDLHLFLAEFRFWE